ncbi:hypothetical protein YC2023_030510 [Brassica napus]
MEMSMKLSEDFTKKLGFSEEGEEEEFSFACVNAEGSPDLLFDQNDGVSETDDEEINRPRLRKVLVESHIPTEKSPDDIRISKGNNDDLVECERSLIQVVLRLREDVLGDRGSVSARNPPPARSDHAGFTLPPVVSSVPEYASVDFDQDERQGKAAWEWFLQTDSMVMKVVSRQEIMVWYQSGPYSYGG